MSPSLADEDGSPTMQWSTRSPSAIRASTTRVVPSVATPSSSPVIRNDSEPLGGAGRAETAAMKAAMAPFMSTAPRPCSSPSDTVPAKGSCRQAAASPTGTTSVWPAKQRFGPSVPRRAYRFSIPAKGMRRQLNPRSVRACSTTAMAPSSAGVTDGRRISAWARATGSSGAGADGIVRI